MKKGVYLLETLSMHCTTNRVLVTELGNNRWIDRITTPNGYTLFVAPTSKVQTYDIKYSGTVVATPQTLTGYRKNDGQVRISKGDTVYFNYKTLLREPIMRIRLSEAFPELENPEEDPIINIWECDYADIFCRIADNNEIMPIGDWVLLEKIDETEMLGSGVLINPFEQSKKGQATIAYISPGANVESEDGPLRPGDTVYFKHDEGAFENTILNKKYWCCSADLIQAKI